MFSRPGTITVAFAPAGVALRESVGGDEAVREEGVVPATPRDWRPAMAGLEGMLAAHAGRKARCAVRLSHSLTRFLVVPWSDALMERHGAQRFLHDQFAAVFGDAADAWVYAVEDAAYRQPRLVCAVERDLLAALRQAVRTAGARLFSVAPWWVTAFNRQRKEMAGDGWFVAVEPEQLAMLEMRDGGARQLALQDWSGDCAKAIECGVMRAGLRAGRASGLPVRVCDIAGGKESWLAAMTRLAP